MQCCGPRVRPGPGSEKFREFVAKYGCEPFEIHCDAASDVLIERYRIREERGVRHPVHVDSMRIEDLRETLEGGLYGPLDVGGTLIRLDTTDFDMLDYASLFNALEAALERG